MSSSTFSASRALHPANPVGLLAALSRHQLFGGLFLLGFVSAVTDRVISSILSRGFAESVSLTFDVSAIVWGSCYFALSLAGESQPQKVGPRDWIAAAIAATAFLFPATLVNWVALTCFSGYVAFATARRSPLQRSAWIVLAVTFTMFWSPRIFAVFSEWILAGDAELVSWITGTGRVGNTVQLRDGSGYLWIAPTCSSMANISLAVLCWTAFAQLSARAASKGDVAICIITCLCVIAINVTRIGLIGYYPDWYEALHGSIGTVIFGYLTLVTIVGICVLWKRRELLSTR
jgi:exosortase/archaeosortase family protein